MTCALLWFDGSRSTRTTEPLSRAALVSLSGQPSIIESEDALSRDAGVEPPSGSLVRNLALDSGYHGEGDADEEERCTGEHHEGSSEREGAVRRGVDDKEQRAGTAHDPCDCCEDAGEQDESSSVGHEIRIGDQSVLIVWQGSASVHRRPDSIPS